MLKCRWAIALSEQSESKGMQGIDGKFALLKMA